MYRGSDRSALILSWVVKIPPHINANILNYCLVIVPALWFQVSALPLARKAASLIEKETNPFVWN
jgi:hypothetical protein